MKDKYNQMLKNDDYINIQEMLLYDIKELIKNKLNIVEDISLEEVLNCFVKKDVSNINLAILLKNLLFYFKGDIRENIIILLNIYNDLNKKTLVKL